MSNPIRAKRQILHDIENKIELLESRVECLTLMLGHVEDIVRQLLVLLPKPVVGIDVVPETPVVRKRDV